MSDSSSVCSCLSSEEDIVYEKQAERKPKPKAKIVRTKAAKPTPKAKPKAKSTKIH